MIKNTYIIGHKSPDTDSVCAAISYARLKQAQGEKDVIAARAGNINSQTEFVLNFLSVPAPLFVPDVVPKVSDAMTKEVTWQLRDTSLKEILRIMEEKNIRLIPLLDEDKRYYGTVTLFDAAVEFRREAIPQSSRKVFTSIRHVHQALGGELLCAAKNVEETFEGTFLVGAMQEVSFGRVLSGLDIKNCLVITGDRNEIQQAAIQRGVKALIVTGKLPVDPEIRRTAELNGVNLMTSPYDTATTVGLVRLSTPAYKVAQNHDGYLSPDEDLENAKIKLLNSYDRGMVVLDGQQRLLGIITMADLLRLPKTRLILVDHNEISQAVNGADQAEIIEVIDHHRLANPQTVQPIFFINQPVGSTCTMVAKFYFDQQVEMDAQTAGLLMSGIISDTLNLKSPTATPLDEQMLNKLKLIAGLDFEAYANSLLSAGMSLAGRSPEEIILNDFKEYKEDKVNFGVGQSEVVGLAEFDKIKPQIIAELINLRHSRGYHFAALMVTDISTSYSLLVFDGTPALCRRLGYPMLEPHVAELKGVLSRKKQLLPYLLSIFKDAKPE